MERGFKVEVEVKVERLKEKVAYGMGTRMARRLDAPFHKIHIHPDDLAHPKKFTIYGFL